MESTTKTVCSHDCPDACSVLVTVDDASGDPVATRFRGDPEHPFTRGFLCGKVNSYETIVYDENRVLWPLRRRAAKGAGREGFERISWDDAIGEIATRIARCRDEHGGESLALYYYAGTMGIVNRFAPEALFNRLGATRLRQNICYNGADAGYVAVVGSGYGVDPEDVVAADLIVVWGCNVVTTQVHLMQFVDEARRKGAPLIVIDPYRNRTARAADEWIPVRPGTDAALALALMHVIERDGQLDTEFIAARTIGFERLSREVLPKYTPAAASAITGVPAVTIEALAQRIGAASAPLFKAGIGLGRSSQGGAGMRSICCLAGSVGAWQQRGGGVLYDTGCEFRFNVDAVKRPDWLTEPTRELPMTGLAKALEEWDDPPIRTLWVHGSNPVATAPLQGRLRRGLSRDDLFTVVHDRFLSDTARYADIVLPAPTFPESSDLHRSYGHLYLQFGKQAIPRRGECRTNLEVVQAVARALGLDDPWFDRDVEDHARALLDTTHANFAGVDVDRVLSGEAFRLAVPQGESGFATTFPTPSGKLEFESKALEDGGLPAVVDWGGDPFDTDPDLHPLRLITPPAHAFLHTSFAGADAIRKERGEPHVLVHPSDAEDIASGDVVELFNEHGSARLIADVTDDVVAGTVVAESVWPPGLCRGGKGINALCSDRVSDLGAGSTFHDNRVGLRKA